MHREAQDKPQKNVYSSGYKKLTKEKRVQCLVCYKIFRNRYGYIGHKKAHDKEFLEKTRKRMMENNPMDNPKYRKKVSESQKKAYAAGKFKVWNKGIKWTKDKWHDKIVEKTEKDLKKVGFYVLTTHGYIPDAIIIDFKNRKVKAFELNPGSIISKGVRAKEKGYDELIVKVRRNGKYSRKNMDRAISTSEF